METLERTKADLERAVGDKDGEIRNLQREVNTAKAAAAAAPAGGSAADTIEMTRLRKRVSGS